MSRNSVNDPTTIQLKDMFGKIPSLKEASAVGLCDVYPRTSSCVESNPEERYPVVKDLTLVRAAQLASLRLLHCLPEHDQTEFVVKMYSSLEERFNSLLKTRILHLGNWTPSQFQLHTLHTLEASSEIWLHFWNSTDHFPYVSPASPVIIFGK